MKQFILVFILFLTFSSAAFNNFFKDSENPNGDPFVLSLGIEKNIHSFKYYNQSTFYANLCYFKIILKTIFLYVLIIFPVLCI